MPAFEDDLRLVREARSRTFVQIQQETRIPVDVLKRFEDGHLVGDPTYNEVYLRAFLRSYARALGVPQGDVLAAYDRSREGTYRGELHPDFDPAAAPPPPVSPLAGPDGADPSPLTGPESPGPTVRRDAPAAPAPPPVPPVSPPVDGLRERPPVSHPPIVVPTRVGRPGVKGARRPYDKNWTSILLLTGLVVAALAVALYVLVFRGTDETEATVVAADGAAVGIDSAAVGAGRAGGGPQLQLPIQVTVSAAGDGLQSFTVTSDGERAPYWINAGESRPFTADSALVLSGEGAGAYFSDATVELQGIRWTPADGRPLTISRATGQRLLDSLSAAGGPAPDTTAGPGL